MNRTTPHKMTKNGNNEFLFTLFAGNEPGLVRRIVSVLFRKGFLLKGLLISSGNGHQTQEILIAVEGSTAKLKQVHDCVAGLVDAVVITPLEKEDEISISSRFPGRVARQHRLPLSPLKQKICSSYA